MSSLTLGQKTLELPLLQGGMGIGVSRCRLAGAVAYEGAMGVISAAQIGYDQDDFRLHPESANLRELPRQIKRAKALAFGRGMIGVNIMAVTQLYSQYVKTACEAGADATITGAGLPLSLTQDAMGFDVLLAPIVSSVKALQVILKYWDKKYHRTADFLVAEGPLAGGHLGFSFETLAHLETYDFRREVRGMVVAKRIFEEKYQRSIPLFVAGGMLTEEDIANALKLGADGVQVASRFVTTKECDANMAFKKAYLQAEKEDTVVIKSPVGMPGRAIRNPFVERMQAGKETISGCYQCLKACDPRTAPYCITQALIRAVQGQVEDGLIFCGARVGELNRITTVKEAIRELGFGKQRKEPQPILQTRKEAFA